MEVKTSDLGGRMTLPGEEVAMNYEEWIGRERRVRIKLLMDSAVIQETGLYPVCQGCGEICLCHEQTCPNCNLDTIVEEKLDDVETEVLSEQRIRCRYRFEHLAEN